MAQELTFDLNHFSCKPVNMFDPQQLIMEEANGESDGATLMVNINTNGEGRFVQVQPKLFHSPKILMEEAQIVIDVEASPLSESMQREASPLSESMQREASPLSESMQRDASPLSELMQRKIDRAKTYKAKNFTIFRTQHNHSKSRKNLFEPAVISIGPFHRGKKSLKAMEEHKWRCLESLLSGQGTSLDLCISEMNFLEETTRRCYNEMFDDLDSHAFVEMMLLDGCFLLEYFTKKFEGNWNSILEVGWNSGHINRDLVLRENQIPFFIVDKLYRLTGFSEEYRIRFLKFIALNLLPQGYIFPAETPDPLTKIPDPPAEIHHLLHLCYHYTVPHPGIPVVLSSKPFVLIRMFSANRIMDALLRLFRSRLVRRERSPHSNSTGNSTADISSLVIPSATELKQKGLKFRPKSNPKHMLDISFEYGILKIPKLIVGDEFKPIFANLIAFEHSKYGKENLPFTSFVIFLDTLVNTPNDVTILQESGIIENGLGSEEAFTDFINQATEGAIFEDDHYLKELYREVNRYSESSWNRHRAKFISDYFSNPWAAISLIAAFVLLVLTLQQSFFAVFAYFRPPKP